MSESQNVKEPFRWIINKQQQMDTEQVKTRVELKNEHYRPLKEIKPINISFDDNLQLESSNWFVNPLNTTGFREKDVKGSRTTLKTYQHQAENRPELEITQDKNYSAESCNFVNITELKEPTFVDNNCCV